MNIEIPEFSEAQELNEQGAALVATGNYEAAIRYFEKAKKADSKNIDSYINLGTTYAAQENYDKAFKEFKVCILIDKTNPDPYFHLGNISFLKNDFDKGLEYYNKAISYGFENPQLYFNLGMVYDEMGKYTMAIRNYTKAISLDKFNPEYRLKQVLAYINNDNFDEALIMLEEFNKFCPDAFEGYHLTFEIYCAKQMYKEAEEVVERAVKLFPKDVSLFFDKIKLTSLKGNHEDALKMIEEAQKMEGFEIERRNLEFEKAKIYAEKEDINNLIKHLESTVSYEEEYIDYEARYILMNAYLGEKNYEKLLENAEILIENSDNGQSSYIMAAYYYRALSLKTLGRMEEAKKQYLENCKFFRALSISNPGSIDAYMFRILCHKDIEEYDKALELADYALLLKADSGEIYAMKASIYNAMGDEERYKDFIKEAGKYNKIYLTKE